MKKKNLPKIFSLNEQKYCMFFSDIRPEWAVFTLILEQHKFLPYLS